MAEDFSFALAVVLTPPIIVLELYRLLKAREWQTTAGIQPAEWPVLARAIVEDLKNDRPIQDAQVRARFDAVQHRGLNERVKLLAARLRDREGTT